MIVRLARQPPNLDQKMNQKIIADFLLGPIFYSIIGYFMYSETAIFSNEAMELEYMSDQPASISRF